MPQILKSPISLGPGMRSGFQSCKNLTPTSTQMKLAWLEGEGEGQGEGEGEGSC